MVQQVHYRCTVSTKIWDGNPIRQDSGLDIVGVLEPEAPRVSVISVPIQCNYTARGLPTPFPSSSMPGLQWTEKVAFNTKYSNPVNYTSPLDFEVLGN